MFWCAVGRRNSARQIYQTNTKHIPANASTENQKKNDLMYIQMCGLRQHIPSYDTFVDTCDIFDIFGFPNLGLFLVKHICFKNNIFKMCFRESAKCRMTAQTGVGNCNVPCILQSNPNFVTPTTFRFLCLINSFYRRFISCMYNIFNVSNISPMHPIYSLSVQYIMSLDHISWVCFCHISCADFFPSTVCDYICAMNFDVIFVRHNAIHMPRHESDTT